MMPPTTSATRYTAARASVSFSRRVLRAAPWECEWLCPWLCPAPMEVR
jgi:hypothetical protein